MFDPELKLRHGYGDALFAHVQELLGVVLVEIVDGVAAVDVVPDRHPLALGQLPLALGDGLTLRERLEMNHHVDVGTAKIVFVSVSENKCPD